MCTLLATDRYRPFLVLGVLSLVTSCVTAASEALPGTAAGSVLAERACDVEGSEQVAAIRASEYGVVFARASGTALHLQRLRGSGCAVFPDESRPVAAGALLDFDDHGAVYVFPARAEEAGVVSTWQEEGGAEGVVTRVDLQGRVAPVVVALRGIWDFGVEPGGETFWVSSCGPTGVFSGEHPHLTQALTPPDTLWRSTPNVMTGGRTFWSVGYRTCSPSEPDSPACGFALTRTTPEGSEEFGTTLMDLGAGFEPAMLSRCGTAICGVFPEAIVIWNDRGELTETVRVGQLVPEPGVRILEVTGNRAGLYLLLGGREGTFVKYLEVR